MSATENISENPEGILLESMLEGFAEYFSAELAVKVTRGMVENAMKGKYNGGAVTLGYRIDENKDYQLDPITAPAVLEMFEMYAAGASMQEIVDNMNAMGIRSGQGNMMSINGVTRMLHNRKYIGEYKFKDDYLVFVGNYKDSTKTITFAELEEIGLGSDAFASGVRRPPGGSNPSVSCADSSLCTREPFPQEIATSLRSSQRRDHDNKREDRFGPLFLIFHYQLSIRLNSSI